MKKKRLLALLLALAMLLPLPGMMGEVHAESQQSPPECTTHNPMEQAYDIPAGCTEPGYTNAVRCYDCGKILSYDSIIPPTGHSYTTHKWEWIHSTCTEEGELEWMCDNPGCGQTERHTLPPLGHVPVPCAEEPASCLYDGHTGGTRCSRCDKILTEPEVVPALGHKFSRLCTEWGATCVRAAGYRNCCSREGCMEESTVDNYIGESHGIHRWSYAGREQVGQDYKHVWICEDCNKRFYADDSNTSPSVHTFLTYETENPTCTEDGYKDRLICRGHCGQVLSQGITLSARGHALGEIIIEHPDCTNPGRAYKQCAHGCGERTEEYELPATGHSRYADYSSAGCTDNGVWRCRTCGAADDTVEVEPRGHDWVSIHTVPANGCEQPGKEIQYCTRCGTRQDIITEIGVGTPYVISVERQSPEDEQTEASNVTFLVTFSEVVSGVSPDDFTLTTTGTVNAAIDAVSSSTGTGIEVTVKDITGSGTLRLDVKDSGTGIMDADENTLSRGYSTGEIYTINNGGGGPDPLDECFIATAAFGSKFTWPVALLRQFRDQYLLTNHVGTVFVKLYYQYSPPIAHYIAAREGLKFLVRVCLAPFIAVVYMLYHPIFGIAILILLSIRLLFWVKHRRRPLSV